MAYNFHDRLHHNKNRFEEISEQEVILEAFDLEIPILASPILKRPFTMTSMIQLQVERSWWGISVSQLVKPDDQTPFLPQPGMTLVRTVGDTLERYAVVADDPNETCYRYTTANRDRIVVSTVLESVTTE